MVSLEDIKGVWNKVEDYYKVITPKNEKIKQLEEKINLSFHYVLMILTCVIFLLLVVFVKSCIFSNTTIFIIALVACMKNLCGEERDERKWYSFWFLFVLTILNPLLDFSAQIQMFKFFFLIYLAIYDNCMWIDEVIVLLYTKCQSLFEKYVEKFCKEHSD